MRQGPRPTTWICSCSPPGKVDDVMPVCAPRRCEPSYGVRSHYPFVMSQERGMNFMAASALDAASKREEMEGGAARGVCTRTHGCGNPATSIRPWPDVQYST